MREPLRSSWNKVASDVPVGLLMESCCTAWSSVADRVACCCVNSPVSEAA